MNDLEIGTISMPSVLSDPFKKNCVSKILVWISNISGSWCATGIVEFSNGNTNGSQKFNGESFDEVVFKIKNFIDNDLK